MASWINSGGGPTAVGGWFPVLSRKSLFATLVISRVLTDPLWSGLGLSRILVPPVHRAAR
eukprot:5633268-Pyramimonas_sp.AAC.1